MINNYVVAENIDEVLKLINKKGLNMGKEKFQENDVLDTWFHLGFGQ